MRGKGQKGRKRREGSKSREEVGEGMQRKRDQVLTSKKVPKAMSYFVFFLVCKQNLQVDSFDHLWYMSLVLTPLYESHSQCFF